MAVRVKYKADQADRMYNRFTAQVFADLQSAMNFMRQIPAADLVGVEDAATGVAIPAGVNLLQGPNIPAADYTTIPRQWGRRWKQQRAKAGTQIVRVHFWGDSITMGNGITAQADSVAQGFAGIAGDFMRYTYGNGGSGYLTQDIATTTTGSWTLGQGYGGSLGRATTTATKGFTNVDGSQIKIFVENRVGSQGRYRIDGGSFTNITPPGSTSRAWGCPVAPSRTSPAWSASRSRWASPTARVRSPPSPRVCSRPRCSASTSRRLASPATCRLPVPRPSPVPA
jgi:hypothetical protein